MIQSEPQRTNYFTPQNHTPFQNNPILTNNNLPALQFNKFFTILQNYDATTNSSCISNSSTSDEADDLQATITDERKRRRMISNRESARRSRMRKQRQFDELWSQIHRLKTENHNLVDKINYVSESHDRVVLENTRLKEETCDLRLMLADLQITDSYSILRDFEDVQDDEFQLFPDTYFAEQELFNVTN